MTGMTGRTGRTGRKAAGEPRIGGQPLPQRPNRPRLRLRLAALAAGLAVAICWAASALARSAPPASPPPPPAAQAPATPPLPSPARALSSALSLLHPHLPAWIERWLYNPRERTAAAIADVKHGDRRAAVAAADTALRIAPAEPVASYNAGTARLVQAGDDGAAGAGGAGATGGPSGPGGPSPGAPGGPGGPGGPARGGLPGIVAGAVAHVTRLQAARAAEPLLEQAVKAAGPDLALGASYNLGNARFAAGDFAGAVEAYKQALRVAPANRDAKFNLELAWREEQRQQQSSQRGVGPRGGGGRPREGERRETAGQGGSGAAGANPQPGPPREQQPSASSPQQGQRPGQSGQAQTAAGWRGQPSPLSGRQPLPGYQDQPEMSASEAAAVLEAVQNLERQQRRQAALRLARQRAANGEDW